MSKKIYFDLDGTLYDLYNVPCWLEKIKKERKNIFKEGNFLVKYEDFLKCIQELSRIGYSFGVITWLPKDSSEEYCKNCYEEKYEWIQKYLPFITEINISQYGTPKQKCIQKRAAEMILIDDNRKVCADWNTKKQRKAIRVDNFFTALDALEMIIRKYSMI